MFLVINLYFHMGVSIKKRIRNRDVSVAWHIFGFRAISAGLICHLHGVKKKFTQNCSQNAYFSIVNQKKWKKNFFENFWKFFEKIFFFVGRLLGPQKLRQAETNAKSWGIKKSFIGKNLKKIDSRLLYENAKKPSVGDLGNRSADAPEFGIFQKLMETRFGSQNMSKIGLRLLCFFWILNFWIFKPQNAKIVSGASGALILV